MELNMKENLRKFRREKSMTQEQLANHLGITAQSVGKWERGEGFPDITLLPSIAMILGVTVDNLLGVGRAAIDGKIAEYIEQSDGLRNRGEVNEDLNLWEKAYTEFPNEPQVILRLMRALGEANYETQEEDLAAIRRKVELGEPLLDMNLTSREREDLIFLMCPAYALLDDRESAIRYAEMMGDYYTTKNELLTKVYRNGEKVCQHRENIRDLVDVFWFNTMYMSNRTEMLPEEIIQNCRYAIRLFELVYEDRDYGFAAVRLYSAWYNIAHRSALIGDRENCLEAVEKCADFAVLYDEQGAMTHTSHLVRGLKYEPGTNTKNYTQSTAYIAKRRLGLKWFDFVREEPRFRAVMDRLSR